MDISRQHQSITFISLKMWLFDIKQKYSVYNVPTILFLVPTDVFVWISFTIIKSHVGKRFGRDLQKQIPTPIYKHALQHVTKIVIFSVRVMVFNATFNNISAISWRSVLLVEETGVPGEYQRPAASYWQTLSHYVVSSTSSILTKHGAV